MNIANEKSENKIKREIVVRLKIKDVQVWKTDWENKTEKKDELNILSKEIKHFLSEYCGIDVKDIEDLNIKLKTKRSKK